MRKRLRDFIIHLKVEREIAAIRLRILGRRIYKAIFIFVWRQIVSRAYFYMTEVANVMIQKGTATPDDFALEAPLPVDIERDYYHER